MRARMSLHETGIGVELREVLLKDKPAHMLEISPKGTVPVLLLPDGRVLEESLDIMLWATEQEQNQDENGDQNLSVPIEPGLALVDRNDNEFKSWLDRYKYQVGYPEHPMEYYREQAMLFLHDLDAMLEPDGVLSRFTEMAIFPFVRQFAFVDKQWFDQQSFRHLHKWLEGWLCSEIFSSVMGKFPQWHEGQQGVIFPVEVES